VSLGYNWKSRWKTDADKEEIFGVGEPRDVNGHDDGKPTPIAATPPKDTTRSVDGPREANLYDIGRLTPSVATPFEATPTQAAIFGTN
jgi:hypothetical protein